MLTIVGIYGLCLVSEMVWVVWARGIDKGRTAVVVLSAMCLMAFGLITTTAAADDRLLIIPAVLGTGSGALLGMRLPLGPPGPKDDVP